MGRLFLLIAVCLMTAPVAAQNVLVDDKEPPQLAPKAIKLTEASLAKIRQQIQKTDGRIVVVDFWSTACLPCMKEFPRLVSLQKKYPKTVQCVSVNLDYLGIESKPPEYYRPRVEKFLNAVESNCRNYLCSTESDEVFSELKLSSIPAVFVFDSNGKLARRFDDSMMKPGRDEAFSYQADIEPFIAELVQKLPPQPNR